MKRTLALITLLAALATVSAQEQIPSNEARQLAERLLQEVPSLDNPQVKVEPDAAKSIAIRAGESAGLMILPDKNLSEQAFRDAKSGIVPIGQLWTRGISPAPGGNVVKNDRLRIISIATDNSVLSVPLFLLGARKSGDSWELVVFGKEKEPVAVRPLAKASGTQSAPLEISGEKVDEETGKLVIKLAGGLQADLLLKQQSD